MNLMGSNNLVATATDTCLQMKFWDPQPRLVGLMTAELSHDKMSLIIIARQVCMLVNAKGGVEPLEERNSIAILVA